MAFEALHKKIFDWYAVNKRDLPWRKTKDPYKILVSEIMLQQTQVNRVIEKYKAFLTAFPTVQALAAAKRADVLKLWSGLGYNHRAVRLHELAKQVTNDFHGKFPEDLETLQSLPGLGPYTAAAVSAFAFNKDVICIDTNIRRVLIHELNLDENISMKELQRITLQVLPKGQACDWYNALMDYGSLVLDSKKTGIKPLTQQSKFIGSTRWYRGQLMKLLIEKKHITIKELVTLWKKEQSWIEDLVKTMQKEGLLQVKENKVMLP